MIALGTGAQRAVKQRIERLGTTLLQIDEANIRVGGVQQQIKVKVTAEDARMIADRSPHVTAVQVQQDANKQVFTYLLAEAVVLCIAGGAIGVRAGVGAGGQRSIAIPTRTPPYGSGATRVPSSALSIHV